MNNSRYTLLYGIAQNVENISLKKFQQEYLKKPIELFNNRDYVRRIGEKLQEKEDNNTLGMTANRRKISEPVAVLFLCPPLNINKNFKFIKIRRSNMEKQSA